MKRILGLLVLGMGVASAVWAGQDPTQASSAQGTLDIGHKAEQSMALVLIGDGNARVQSAAVGAIIRADGILLTAYHPIKSAKEVQVRLADGEVYDQVDLLGFDERRNVAALHFTASGIASFSLAGTDKVRIGDRVRVLTADGTMAWSSADGVAGPVRLAEEIMGAGHGYRVIQFMAPPTQGVPGGALVNSQGQLLGIITGPQNNGGQQFAVPVESVAGLSAQGLRTALGNGTNLSPPPFILSLMAAPDDQHAPTLDLANARSLRVISRTTFFAPFTLQKELLGDSEFRALGLSVVDGYKGGDLLVTIDRPLFTYDFTYSVSDSHTGVVVATGKVTAIDGPHAAQGIARKLIQEFEKARTLQGAQANPEEARTAQ